MEEKEWLLAAIIMVLQGPVILSVSQGGVAYLHSLHGGMSQDVCKIFEIWRTPSPCEGSAYLQG